MKKAITKIGVISAALLTLAISVNAQWTQNATSVYLTNGTKKVGIGTTAPGYPLDIKQQGNCNFRVQSLTSGSANLILARSTAATANCFVNYKTGTTALWYTGVEGSSNGFRIRNGAGTDYVFVSQASGNVGIGTVSPTQKLHVVGQGYFQGNRPSFSTAVDNNMYISNSNTGYAGLSLFPSTNSLDGASIFGGTGGIGLNVVIANSGVNYGPVNASAFNVASDRRMKKEIVDINSDSYEKYMTYIRNIESATFRYKTETDETRNVQHIGLIAQSLPVELQAHITESPTEKSEDRLAVSLADLSGLMVVGIKALDSKQTDLEKVIADQQKQIDELKAMLNSGSKASQVKSANPELQTSSSLFQNSPNPFNQTTVIRYALSNEDKSGKIIIRDLNGNLVKQISIAQSGKGQVTINANELSQGTYTYTLEIGGTSVDTKLMVVTK